MRKGLSLPVLFVLGWALAGPARAAEASVNSRTRVKPAPARKATRTSPRILRSRLKTNFKIIEAPPPPERFKEPGDLVDLIPIVRDINRMIPRNFTLANQDFKILNNKLIINHEFLDYRARTARKASTISFSYSGGWGPTMNAQVDVPLFYSEHPLIYGTGWSRYPVGNYTMTLNQGGNRDESVFIRAQTKF